MQGAKTSLCLFLLLNQLMFCLTEADQSQSTMHMNTYKVEDQRGSSGPSMEPSHSTYDHPVSPNTDTYGARAYCFIDTEMGLIAIGSAGGLIVCLLVATVVLACQVFHIQQLIYAPQTSDSNIDLVSSASYWGTDLPDVGGVEGPCDTRVTLDELRAESGIEGKRQDKIQEAKGEGRTQLKEGAVTLVISPGQASQMPSSSSRDSCLEVPKYLEDMPLVV